MREPPAVTDEDLTAAFTAYYARPAGLEHIEVLPPLPDAHGQEILAALRRALEADRKRVAESNYYSENRRS